jgi:hypothetical protein
VDDTKVQLMIAFSLSAHSMGSVLVSELSPFPSSSQATLRLFRFDSWDKQLAAICGRPPLMRLYDFDVSLPLTTDRVLTIFNQYILLNALL